MKIFKILTFGLLVFTGGFMVSSCADQSNNINSGAVEIGSGGLELKEPERTGGLFSFLPLGVYMSVVDYDQGILTVDISNQSGYTTSYGGEYYLQKKVGEVWTDLPLPEGFVFTEGVKSLEDLDENLEKYDLNVFGKLTAGDYRLKKTDLEVIFTLIEKK